MEKTCCNICGAELNSENTVGVSGTCFSCQSDMFLKLEEANGTHMAIFLMCGMNNIPCEPTVIPKGLVEKKDIDRWEAYLDALSDSGKWEDGENIRTFTDGVCDLRMIFGRELTEKDFAKYIEMEKDRLEHLPGTVEQRKMWGEDSNYTTEDYNELDRQYKNRLASFRGVTVTDQMDDTLHKISEWNLLISKFVKAGNIKAAKDLQSMVETALASEQMRKKDEKPVEELRIDALVDAMEKMGLMENGQFLTFEETKKALQDNFVKSKKYDYSVDVADQVIFLIYNAMMANADLPMLTDLPEDMQVVDEYGEFEEEETESEKENKRYANLTKIHNS